jgi:hypothetical protein
MSAADADDHTLVAEVPTKEVAVVIVGTSHDARESPELVADVIAQRRPTGVVLELDPVRARGLFHADMHVRSLLLPPPPHDIGARPHTTVDIGLSGILLALIFTTPNRLQRRTVPMETMIGADQREGGLAAARVGAGIRLGDRDTLLTFGRAASEVGLWTLLRRAPPPLCGLDLSMKYTPSFALWRRWAWQLVARDWAGLAGTLRQMAAEARVTPTMAAFAVAHPAVARLERQYTALVTDALEHGNDGGSAADGDTEAVDAFSRDGATSRPSDADAAGGSAPCCSGASSSSDASAAETVSSPPTAAPPAAVTAASAATAGPGAAAAGAAAGGGVPCAADPSLHRGADWRRRARFARVVRSMSDAALEDRLYSTSLADLPVAITAERDVCLAFVTWSLARDTAQLTARDAAQGPGGSQAGVQASGQAGVPFSGAHDRAAAASSAPAVVAVLGAGHLHGVARHVAAFAAGELTYEHNVAPLTRLPTGHTMLQTVLPAALLLSPLLPLRMPRRVRAACAVVSASAVGGTLLVFNRLTELHDRLLNALSSHPPADELPAR